MRDCSEFPFRFRRDQRGPVDVPYEVEQFDVRPQTGFPDPVVHLLQRGERASAATMRYVAWLVHPVRRILIFTMVRSCPFGE